MRLADGSYGYAGESDMIWDGQEPIKLPDGTVQVYCEEGHEWDTPMAPDDETGLYTVVHIYGGLMESLSAFTDREKAKASARSIRDEWDYDSHRDGDDSTCLDPYQEVYVDEIEFEVRSDGGRMQGNRILTLHSASKT